MVLIWVMAAVLGRAGDYQITYNNEPIELWGMGCGERLRTNLRFYLKNDKVIRISGKKVYFISAEGPFKPFWTDTSGSITTMKYQWDAYSPMFITADWTKNTIQITVSRKFDERDCGVRWRGNLKYVANGVQAATTR